MIKSKIEYLKKLTAFFLRRNIIGNRKNENESWTKEHGTTRPNRNNHHNIIKVDREKEQIEDYNESDWTY
jgi:hypothetical protein